MTNWLEDAAQRGIRYVNSVNERRVFPEQGAIDALAEFDEPFPQQPASAESVIALLDDLGGPATVATTGSRYFGFVIGGLLPAAMAASWLMSAWDQNGVLYALSPVNAVLEKIALRWVVDALGLPEETVGGFVTGATMANFTALAAARHHLLARAGWDVEAQGLFGAPEIKVVVGEEVHVSLLQALMLLGLGRERVIRVPVDGQGRMLADQLPEVDAMTIVCLQAGNVNSGAFDPAQAIIDKAHEQGAWVHVDGAFGLWVMAAPAYAHLAAGYQAADSFSTDGHKWLNVSYDNGIVLCRHEHALRAAMTVHAPYLVENTERQPSHYTPELSRRARGIEIWAALKSLGREGLAEMIERNCQLAAHFASGLSAAGFTVHNEVVINQVMVSFGDAEQTLRVIEAIQKEGTLWAGQSVWHGQTVMRISVSSWATTQADIERCLEAIVTIANQHEKSH